MVQLLEWLPSTDQLKAFFESNFTAAAVGSFFGALGGAWAAQRIAEKAKTRELQIKEIRQSNAAATLLNSIANTHIGLKKQHIKSLYDDFFEQRSQFEAFKRAFEAQRVPPQQVFDYKADMEMFSVPYTPAEQVRKLIFEELSPAGGQLFIAPLLFESIQGLGESLDRRNDLIREWKKNPHDPINPAAYFGFKQGNVTDAQYKSLVENIFSKNDEVISFSMMLAESFLDRAKWRRDQYIKLFGRSTAPGISTFDFSEAEPYLPQKDEHVLRFEKMLKQSQARDSDAESTDDARRHPYHRLWRRVFHHSRRSNA